MARFGHYVTVHELRRTGLTAVYSGHDDRNPEDNFAIKVLEPSVLFEDKEREKIGANQFLNSARLQQKLFARGSQHWAQIYKYGSSPDGTFYVTDRYERSLQEMIDGHVAPSQKILHVIIRSITEGLIELKKAYKRPHGNLKATNVLITGDFSEMKVALSDPLPDESIDAKVHWYADLKAIGELIYQLVVHRPAPSLAGTRISDSKEWVGLKRQKDAWRHLCERLLAVSFRPDAITLESLVEELTELGKSKPVFSLNKFAVLSIILLLIGTSVFIYVKRKSQVTAEDREDFLKDYFSWVKALNRNLGFSSVDTDFEKSKKKGPAKDWIDEDPDLEEIIGKNDYGNDSPIWIAGLRKDPSTNDDEIIKEIRDQNKDPDYIKNAIDYVKDLREFFNPDKGNWPLLVEIHKAAKSLGENEEKWLQPAGSYLNYLVDKVKPPNKQEYKGEVPNISPKKEEIYEGVNEILELKKNLELKRKDIRKIQEEIEKLRKEIGKYVNGKRKKVDYELLGMAEEYSDIITYEKFNRYLDEIRGFRNIEDIHEEYKNKWNPNYTRVSELVENLKSMSENTENADKFGNTLKDLKKNFNEFKQNLEKEGIYYIAKNEDRIKKRYEDLMDNLQNLWDGIVKDLNDPSDWLEDVFRRKITASDMLEDKWQRRRQELLPDDTCGKLRSDDYITYTSVEFSVETSWDRLNKLQTLGSVFFQNFKEQLRTADEQTIQIDGLTDGYKTALEEAFKEIEDDELFDNATAIPDMHNPASFKYPLWRKLAQLNPVNGFESMTSATNLAELVRAYGNICEQFRLFYPLDANGTKKYVEIFEDRLDNFKNDKVFSEFFDSDSEVCEAFSRLESKISNIRKITDMQLSELRSQVKEVLSETDDLGLYVVYVGLEKPSGDPWPRDSKEWNLEGRMKTALLKRIKAIQDGDGRVAQLVNDLESIFAKRQEHFEKLKPLYCERLDFVCQNSQNVLVFAENIALRDKFEPVMNAKGDSAVVSAWDDIRQAVDKQGNWIDFFYTTDVKNEKNVGWPKYIRSTKDHSVILRFIPAGNGNPEPFYMAIREITNVQYESFLSKNEAEEKERAYHDTNNNILLIRERYPPYSLYWDNNNEELREYPVTYVTHHGAQSYATWLAARLPSDKQHEFAFRAASDDTLPWSDQSQILTFAHVRARPWQIAAKQFNDATATEDKPRPLGAKQSDKDYNEEKKLIIERVIILTNPSYTGSAWPIVSSTKSNKWGLYDMVGNVWEWCSDKSICGGSCLAPPEYIPGNRNYVSENYSTTFKDRSARDVGFRVIVLIQ